MHYSEVSVRMDHTLHSALVILQPFCCSCPQTMMAAPNGIRRNCTLLRLRMSDFCWRRRRLPSCLSEASLVGVRFDAGWSYQRCPGENTLPTLGYFHNERRCSQETVRRVRRELTNSSSHTRYCGVFAVGVLSHVAFNGVFPASIRL